MDSHYDVLIIGARVAGASTALHLARAGLRVLVIDKSRYGTDTVSTHALMRAGVLQLARWGVLDNVIESGTPAVHETVFHYGSAKMPLPVKPRGLVDAFYAPRRTVLDRILVDAARDAGAEFRFGARLEDLIWKGHRVVGAEFVCEGERVTVSADRVIGADGANSITARLVGAETVLAAENTIACVLGYFEGYEQTGYQWYFNPGVGAGTLPTNGGHCMFVAIKPERLAEFEGRGHDTFAKVMAEAAPAAMDGFAKARPVGGLRRFRGQKGHLRRAVGPGWALVGDAGYFKDPFTAHGITDALRDSELLARSIIGSTPGDDGALYEYEGIRNQLSKTFFATTDRIASLDWSMGELMMLHDTANRESKKEVRFLLGLDPALRAAS